MNLKLSRRGFTIIELVTVIAIIGILSTLIVVSLDNAKVAGRDSRRLTDITQLQLALKLYYNDLGYYPTAITAGRSIANGANNYILRVPENPSPRTDGDCPDSGYVYSSIEDGQQYSLSFCLGDTTNDLSAGVKTATANGILDCEDGYIPVPGSPAFDTNDFCVMKFEAKCVNDSAPTVGLTSPVTVLGGFDDETLPCDDSNAAHVASIASGMPVTNLPQDLARQHCNAVGGHLMTNAEWMTIARNAEAIGANWSGDETGSGSMYGNDNNSINADTYNQSDVSVQHNNGLRLSTGQFIWRLANNVAEWTDDTCTSGSGSGNYYEDASVYDWSDSNLNDYERDAAGPSDSSWGVSKNIGQYYGCSTNGNAFVRGGGSDLNSEKGLYGLDLSSSGSTQAGWLGFRCVK